MLLTNESKFIGQSFMYLDKFTDYNLFFKILNHPVGDDDVGGALRCGRTAFDAVHDDFLPAFL